MPKRGIGDATVSAVESFAREEGITVIDAARRVDEIVTLAARAKGAVAGFVQVMDALQAHLDDGAGPPRMVEFAAQESGYMAELEEDRTVEAQGRIENLQEIAGVAAEIVAREPDTDLAGFLEQVSLVGEQDEYDEEESVITLMTLHIAKGLEFPVVFMVGTGGRDLPALPVHDRCGRAGGGAAPGVRGHHARRSALCTCVTRGAARCSGRRSTTRPLGSSASSPST